MDYLVNTITRLKNARGFGLGQTDFEMLPRQDVEVDIFRRLGYTDVKCTPDTVLLS